MSKENLQPKRNQGKALSTLSSKLQMFAVDSIFISKITINNINWKNI